MKDLAVLSVSYRLNRAALELLPVDPSAITLADWLQLERDAFEHPSSFDQVINDSSHYKL